MTMSFEPQVLESIHYNRRKILLEEALVLALLLLVLFACVFLMAFTFHKDQELVMAVAIPLAFLVILVYTWSTHGSFTLFTRVASEYDEVSLELFADALENVCLGAGITCPGLVVLDLPTVNFVTFEKRGKHYVGITKDATSTSFSKGEAEAIMAHEISHIITGDALKPLDIWRFKVLPFTSIVFLLLLAIGIILLWTEEDTGGITVPIFFLSYIFIIWSGILVTFVAKRFDIARRHDDILADSIASKITSDPAALSRVVQRLSEMYDAAEVLPREGYCNRHLFVCSRESRTAIPSILELFSFWQTSDTNEDEARWEHTTIRSRVKNLEAIDQGHWPAFESISK
jgi:Zn-dependent protease with chaperone function